METIFHFKEFLMSLTMTLASSVMAPEDKKKKWTYYLGCFVFFYILMISNSQCRADEYTAIPVGNCAVYHIELPYIEKTGKNIERIKRLGYSIYNVPVAQLDRAVAS